jgi:hypothetical protein
MPIVDEDGRLLVRFGAVQMLTRYDGEPAYGGAKIGDEIVRR